MTYSNGLENPEHTLHDQNQSREPTISRQIGDADFCVLQHATEVETNYTIVEREEDEYNDPFDNN